MVTISEPRLPRFTGWLHPVVDAAARVPASVHVKLLFGFMTGAALLVAMAILSVVVIGRMNERVQDVDRLQVSTSRAQQMLYDVTAQSHYRAMALLTRDGKYNAQVADAKASFTSLLGRHGARRPGRRPVRPARSAQRERHVFGRQRPGACPVRRG